LVILEGKGLNFVHGRWYEQMAATAKLFYHSRTIRYLSVFNVGVLVFEKNGVGAT